ncbi:YfhO family protein [Thermospira aquatica]|uniref:YfhO family protein n=1 Tax=Thermospira aquatica TaxID=2828656 RepID=A0AAX3BG02_9SPIR|nr:YfhO family protein [Thermospira aquatica]URA11186.1 YfhO family protein [Thermospira aquatica]
MEKKRSFLILSGCFAGVLLLLFWKSFLGYPLQGIDGSIGLLKTMQNSLATTLGQWHHFYWMGSGATDMTPSFYHLFLRMVPAMWMQNIFYPVVLFLAMAGMWLWLRRIGRSFWGALFGALSYGLMPHWVSLVLGGHLLVFEVMAWFGWLLWALTNTFREKGWRWLGWALLSGFFWGAMMNADIQRGFYLSLIAATMVLVIWIQEDKSEFGKKFPFRLAQSLVVALLMFGVMSVTLGGWLNILEGRKALQEGQNVGLSGWEFATQFSQDPRELIDSLAFGYHGKLSGDPEAPYWGTKEFNGNSDSLGFFLVVFGFLGFSFLLRKDIKREEKVWLGFWGVWTVIGLLLSFGKFWPGKPFYWLFYNLPIMSSFRVPLKWLIVPGVGLVVMGSYAFDKLRSWLEEERKEFFQKLLQVALVLVGVSFLWLLYHVITSDGLYQNLYTTLKAYAGIAVENRGWALVRMTFFFLLVAGAIGLAFMSLRRDVLSETQRVLSRRLAVSFIFGGMLLDLLTINWFYFDRAYVKEGPSFYREDEIIRTLKQAGVVRVAPSLLVEQQARIFPMPVCSIRQAYLTYDFLYHGIEAFDIPAESAVDQDLQMFMRAGWFSSGVTQLQTFDDVLAANLPIFRVANVGYLLLDAVVTNTNYPLVGILRDKMGQPHALYKVNGAFPRVTWFSQAVAVTNRDEAFHLFSRPDWPREKVLVVEQGESLEFPSSHARVDLVSYKPVKLVVEVESDTPGHLLVANRYHKQWRAKIDGAQVPILKANIAQMAVKVPSGKHTVVFSYEAVFLYQVLGWLGVVVALGSGVGLAISSRNNKEQE